MLIDHAPTTAFAPPPASALYEPEGRVGVGAAHDWRPRTLATSSAANDSVPAAIQDAKAAILAGLSRRLESLKLEAQLEGIAFSEASLSDLSEFFWKFGLRKRPALFLND